MKDWMGIIYKDNKWGVKEYEWGVGTLIGPEETKDVVKIVGPFVAKNKQSASDWMRSYMMEVT